MLEKQAKGQDIHIKEIKEAPLKIKCIYMGSNVQL